MTKHQKRLSVPNSWPVERKTDTFTVKADAGPHGEAGVPLLIVLRDVLGYADSRKEARYALNEDSVHINGTPVADEERPVGMFDILEFTERDEYYRVFPGQGGRLSLTPIDADSAGSKLGKVVNKQHVPGGDVQLTLHDGQTLVVDEDAPYDGGDSVIVSNDDSEVVAHFEYEEGALVTAVNGRHAGEVGTVDTIQVTPGSADNNVLVERDDADGFETIEDYVVVIDENFTSEDESGTSEDEAASTDETAASAEDVAESDDETEADEPEAEADEPEAEADEPEAEADEDEDLMDEASEELDEVTEDDAGEELVDDEGGDDE